MPPSDAKVESAQSPQSSDVKAPSHLVYAFSDPITAAVVSCCVSRGRQQSFVILEYVVPASTPPSTWTYVSQQASPLTDFWVNTDAPEDTAKRKCDE